MKSLKCRRPAQVRFSPDLDIRGIGACKEHQEEIKKDLLIATVGNEWEWFDKKYKLKDY